MFRYGHHFSIQFFDQFSKDQKMLLVQFPIFRIEVVLYKIQNFRFLCHRYNSQNPELFSNFFCKFWQFLQSDFLYNFDFRFLIHLWQKFEVLRFGHCDSKLIFLKYFFEMIFLKISYWYYILYTYWYWRLGLRSGTRISSYYWSSVQFSNNSSIFRNFQFSINFKSFNLPKFSISFLSNFSNSLARPNKNRAALWFLIL